MGTSNVSYVVLNLIRIDIRKNYYFSTLRKYSGNVLSLNSSVIGSLGCYKGFCKEMANRMYRVSIFHMSKESYHLHRPGHSETGCITYTDQGTLRRAVLAIKLFLSFVCFCGLFFGGGRCCKMTSLK